MRTVRVPSSTRSIRWRAPRALTALGLVCALVPGPALAQQQGGAAPPTGGSQSGPGAGAPAAGAAAPAAAPANPVYGAPPSQSPSEKYLPSSSRSSTDTSRSNDGFDLLPQGGGSGTVHGREGAAGVTEPQHTRVPGSHVVRRGDTLWDICDKYYHNPWLWPKVWSYNPQVQNPHWIYPGDQLKLRGDGGDDRAVQTLGGLVNRRPNVPRDTVFLRDEGYVDDERRDSWGQISGSPEDRMLLTEGFPVYLEVEGDHELKPEQELTIFKPQRSAGKGAIVQILGTVKIETYDKDKKIARAQIVESLDVIERGARVGPVGRRFDVVPPQRNKNDVSANVLASVWPRVYHAREQVVFLDKGSDDGLQAGNRLFIVRRGDPWRATLHGASDLASKSIKPSKDQGPETESVKGTERDSDYPDEIVGELRVLRVREKTATCLVTSSKKEILSGDLAVARKGY